MLLRDRPCLELAVLSSYFLVALVAGPIAGISLKGFKCSEKVDKMTVTALCRLKEVIVLARTVQFRRFLRWHVCRTKFVRNKFWVTNFLTTDAPNFSQKF